MPPAVSDITSDETAVSVVANRANALSAEGELGPAVEAAEGSPPPGARPPEESLCCGAGATSESLRCGAAAADESPCTGVGAQESLCACSGVAAGGEPGCCGQATGALGDWSHGGPAWPGATALVGGDVGAAND
jgi:hypothetical protein